MPRHFSIRHRLQVVIVATTAVVLLLTCALFLLYQFTTFRDRERRNLQTLAGLIADGANAALAFPDQAEAERTLALLSAETNVRAAGLYDSDGRLFADYTVPDVRNPVLQALDRADGLYRQPGRWALYRPVQMGDTRFGTLYVRWDVTPMYAAMRFYAGVALLMLVGGLIIAHFVGRRLQRTISAPILSLAETAQQVARQNDYRVRPRAHGPDEIGTLTDAFNHMLDEIEQREAALQRVHAELEQRIAERTAELSEANKSLEGFTYTVAHDLRAPLRHVTGFIDLLRRSAGSKLTDAECELIAHVRNASLRMGRLIDDLLEFARLGRSELRQQPVDLGELVADVRQQLEPDSNGRQIEWRIDPLPVVGGDSRLLRQVFYNLLHNALKFTRPRSAAIIEILHHAADGQHVISVRDNGVGFDMQHANKLFNVFQRLHTEGEFEGTGIGLAHVQRIVHRHGGRVWAESAPGQGATIHIGLPVASVHQQAA